MDTKLERIAEVARTRPNERFTSLAHLINKETLSICHQEMSKKKASGVDKVTKEQYGENLEQNLEDLVERMKRQAYKPQPVRRVYIPKPGSDKLRPLGIPAYEDKLVQSMIAKVLNAIYEQEFLESSFGFRPNRSSHDAIKVLNNIVNRKEIEYVVDADIKGFFDHVDQEWMMKFIQHRIADFNLWRIIARFMKAGVMEAGILYDTPEGTPQGGSISPILANIYLHYVMDLWFEKRIRRQCKGAAYMVRYADDAVFCFEYEEDAKMFYQQLKPRLKGFNLEVAEEKTKIVRLNKGDKDNDGGKCSEDDRDNSFDFLGFTHYVGKNRKGIKCVQRKTSKKKYRASLSKVKEWIKENRHTPTKKLMGTLVLKLKGYCRYYAVTGNTSAVSNYIDEVKRILYKWLNRRSQKRSFDWSKFNLFLKKYPLPTAKVLVNIFEIKAGKSYIS